MGLRLTLSALALRLLWGCTTPAPEVGPAARGATSNWSIAMASRRVALSQAMRNSGIPAVRNQDDQLQCNRMRSSPQQNLLDTCFGKLCGDGAPWRGVSDRAFAKARQRLHCPALTWLNDRVIGVADPAGLVPRWHGFRLVAADASGLMPALRACSRTRGLASADRRLFASYLPGPELMLHASVHASTESERAMPAEALDHLGPDDPLLLYRGCLAASALHANMCAQEDPARDRRPMSNRTLVWAARAEHAQVRGIA